MSNEDTLTKLLENTNTILENHQNMIKILSDDVRRLLEIASNNEKRIIDLEIENGKRIRGIR